MAKRGDDDVPLARQDAIDMGERIRQLRGSATQLAFGKRVGIRREHVSRLEAGGAEPRAGTLRRLAEVTGASLDAVVLGAAAATQGVQGARSWHAAIEPLLSGTTLRLPRASAGSSRRADRAWQQLSEARREEIRLLARRVALVAVALEGLLPPKAARAVTDELSAQLSTALIGRILSPP